MVMAAKKGPGPGGGVGGGKAEAEAASEVWCRRVRELGGCSQAGNRHCFECAQRGVTYVDITVGSFVCTTCSGLLRGLNPPHRVKSISMTTFTEPEVVFLQSRGNEVCRKIWLGLFDARTSLIPDSRDPQKVKEFLQEKYEKKRWYVPPDQVKGLAYTKGSASTPVQGSMPEGKPQRTLLGDPVPSVPDAATSASQFVSQSQARTAQARSSQPPSHSSAKKASTDLLADIGGDPFAAPQATPSFAAFPAFVGQTPSCGGFANFDAFGSSPSSSALGSLPPAGQAPFQAQPVPAASRMLTGSYSFGSSQVTPFGAAPLAAASQPSSLTDMGSLLGPGVPTGGVPGSIFGMTGQVPVLQSAMPGGGSTGLAFGAAFTNPFATPVAQPQLPSTNPFQPNGLAPGPGFGMSSAGPGFTQPVPPSGVFASTFPSPLFPPQTSLTPQQNGSSFGDLGSTRLVQRPLSQPSGISTNPFMTGSSPSPFASKSSTTNPFL
ncbi:arf-GAP domain and FG repeat-containing protein 2 isoform X3 [Fukomys damarensis]|uniref:Arf-GAP domain and FG repeats-containing protein 2 n=1 Tax=Fukomys damarensis TaxID=885580 RepID=A0A091EML1_FUKDA|nr:arf-GAP domain and FG repeat-containing protein 2 isoform X3 [Fukomys damarensis]KFO36861.1 Arf-GAP domain and FG repeats-containing protein 2 [Fukomys damarensis]